MDITNLKAAAPKKAKAEKPILPDPTGTLAPLVDQGITANQNVDAHNAVLDGIKAKLGKAALAHLFAAYQGMTKIEDTFKLSGAGGSVMVSVKNAYKLPEDLTPVRAVLGSQARFLRESFVIEVDSQAIPAAVQQVFVDELVKLARACDVALGQEEGDGPCFNAVTCRKVTTMDKAFHEERLRLFTPEENQRIQQAVPCVVSSRFDY